MAEKGVKEQVLAMERLHGFSLNFRTVFIDAAYFAHCFTKYSNIGRESAHSFGFVTGPVMRSGCHCTVRTRSEESRAAQPL